MKEYETGLKEVGPAQLLGVFRLILAVLLSIFYLADKRLWPLDAKLSLPFQVFLAIYLIFLLVTTLIWRKPKFQNNTAVTIFSVIDLALLSALCAYTGGVESPLLFLILVSIMIHGAMMSLRQGLMLVVASIIVMLVFWVANNYVLYQSGYWKNIFTDQHLLRIAAQSLMAFAAIIMANNWGKRVKQSEVIVMMQQQTLIEAAALHEAIVQQSSNGIIVVDRMQHIQLINDLAKTFFAGVLSPPNHPQSEGVEGGSDSVDFPESLPLNHFSSELDEKLKRWLTMGIKDDTPLIVNDKGYHTSFSQIKANESFNIVIVLESEENINQRAQQNKLAALGQLTAGIAHEIRNPLASISQAAQLLEEQLEREGKSTKLPTIINKNVARANRIINDILDIARRNQPHIVVFEIQIWLSVLVEEFKQNYPDVANALEIHVEPNAKFVVFDPSQLRQVIWNLLSNARMHGKTDKRPLKILVSVSSNLSYSWLTVQDNGEGLSDNKLAHLFEPFFSTHQQGTGLGLYLAREICEANQAKIEYIRGMQGAAFRITFSQARGMEMLPTTLAFYPINQDLKVVNESDSRGVK